ncbi:hypothetical protein DFH28DRAFT_1067905 [Melampsora americana]|nr:hypothetical protein DFH28DRAFT_1067905 [Melampsora americana]
MKYPILTSTIFLLVLQNSLVLVQSHINNWYWTPNQLQEGNTEKVEFGINSMGQHHPRSDTIPTAYYQEHHEMSTYLKDLENSIMQDKEYHELDNVQGVHLSDSTAFWINSLEESNAIAEDEYLQGHMYQNSKRTKSTYYPDNCLSPSELHQDQTVERFLKGDTLVHSTSGYNPRMLEVSARPQTESHQVNIVDVQSGAYVPNTQQSPRSQIQFSKTEKPLRSGKLKQKVISHSKFRGRGVFALLELKGSLALWQNPKVSRQIEDWFNRLKRKSIYSSLLCLSENLYSEYQVDFAIERVRKEVVIAYFGGLSILCQGSSMKVPISDLVADGWIHLQNYLEQGFGRGQENSLKFNAFHVPKAIEAHHFSHPLIILDYIVKRGHLPYLHPSLIEALVSHWATKTIYKPEKYNTNSSEESFLTAIELEAKLRGKSFWKYTQDEIKNKPTPISNLAGKMKPDESDREMKKLIKKIGDHTPGFLQKIGRYLVKDWQTFSNDVNSFFQDLETAMKDDLERAKVLTNGDISTSGCQNEMIMNYDLIQKAIQSVNIYIVPAFIGALILFHQSQESDDLIEILLSTGLSTLKAYFSLWKDIFTKDLSSIILNEETQVPYNVRWYDPKDSLHYLCLHKRMGTESVEIVWFLSEIWYEQMVHKKLIGNMKHSFELVPPYRPGAHEIISFFETRGISFR